MARLASRLFSKSVGDVLRCVDVCVDEGCHVTVYIAAHSRSQTGRTSTLR